MKKVAIYQNNITYGGRIRVITSMSECLNKIGVVPDWISYQCSFKTDDLSKIHSIPIKAKLKIINAWNRGLGEIKYIKLNKIISKMSKEYDLVINSNNVLSGIENGDNFLHYIHFPREARVMSEYNNSVYKSKFFNTLFHTIYVPYLKNINTGYGIIVNSEFSRKAIQKAYGIPIEDCSVFYPPIAIKNKLNKNNEIKKLNTVISVGRFGKDKNQFQQIKIAEKLPQLKFIICGYTSNNVSKEYFNYCESYIKKNNIQNVLLKKNASSSELEKIHSASQFFLHTMREEPFGISTVEAILNGCIPVVHNSGGSAEIVRKEQLLYSDISDATNKLKLVCNMNQNHQSQLINELKNGIKKYDELNFKNSFTNKLKTIFH
jgi:glycosyltransferase involved in cell wall biosynthesis